MLVDDGGCSGFQYNFKMISHSSIKPQSDYMFSCLFEGRDISIVVDSITMDFINKSTVDYK